MTGRRRATPGQFDGLHGRSMLRALAAMTVDGGDAGECWDWVGAYTGGPHGLGYPAVSVRIHGERRVRPAHRVSYEAAFGAIPDGEQVHHRCARRTCIRPEHLETATAQQNVGEMLARRALERRIAVLEAALAEFMPDHDALDGYTPEAYDVV